MSLEERLAGLLPEGSHRLLPTKDGMLCLAVEREHYRLVMEALRGGGFESCTFVTAVDRHPSTPRFELRVQLLSLASNERIRLCVVLQESEPSVASICDLWPGASFSERECWDMFGIRFEGHPDLRRLLMPDGYEHHPLRKDFPHHGIQPDRLYRAWERAREQSPS